jgi:hypothetical protein
MKFFNNLLVSVGLATAACGASSSDVGTKEVSDHNNIVRFNIPSNWIEELEDNDGVMFYGPSPNSGTLRPTVITASSATDLSKNEPIELLKGLRGVDPATIKWLPNGNATASNVTHTSEHGTPITLFWWYLTNPVTPKHVRVATFSYTVVSTDEHSQATVDEVEMLEKSIHNAKFNPDLGSLQ